MNDIGSRAWWVVWVYAPGVLAVIFLVKAVVFDRDRPGALILQLVLAAVWTCSAVMAVRGLQRFRRVGHVERRQADDDS